MDRFVADALVTMEAPDTHPIPHGAVDVEDGAIVWAGPHASAPPRDTALVHRVAGILMPGLVDIHCHTPMVLMRGAGEGLPVDRWLSQVMWPREAKLTPDDVAAGMRWGATELLLGGVTTSVEMYFHSDAMAQAVDEIGMRALITPPVLEDEQLESYGPWQRQLDAVVGLGRAYAEHPRIEVGIAPHAAYSVSNDCMLAIADVSRREEMIVHIHVAEQRWEDDAVRQRTGMGAPAYLESVGILDGRVLAAHSVWLDDSEIDLFASFDVAVAHCPCSNMKHASGVAPVPRMLEAGLRVGIATDGPASHHRLDMFEEMRTAIRLARVSTGDAGALDAFHALWMSTAGAADAIGRADLGRLVAGARADMIAVRPTSTFGPMVELDEKPAERTVWSGSRESVSDVWVEGRRVVQDSVITSADREEIQAEATRRAARLLS